MKMKKFLFMGLMCSLPTMVFAKDFETKDGYVIPEAEYENLSKIHTEAYLYTMPYEEYQELLSYNLDYDSVNTTTKYIYTACNMITGECANNEISKAEYENSVYVPSPCLDTTVNTTYKMLTLTFLPDVDYGTAYVSLDNTWKIMPSVRSYDVSAVRFGNLTAIRGTEHGKQIYKKNGVYDYISYGASGTNINVQDNGFGISMNILDGSDVTEIETTISASLELDGIPAVVYGSYQHAIKDVSLSQSKNYTLGAGGLGSTIKFAGNIGDNYDKMLGVYDDILPY